MLAPLLLLTTRMLPRARIYRNKAGKRPGVLFYAKTSIFRSKRPLVKQKRKKKAPATQ